eukprot:CAMPEP_0116896186 /NCGR_PEP_ID=MMETSP0467-20121206/5494_1 /TAXON_ID=283647 /ORGANISM="Mesodinium pulex, Strain SPMC105" /LENGTH=95 /DNA_ID=CAMNT_0004567233 /DNA_START=752 /DNA_END=1039 /DNA_ORIENTATION=-
MMNELENEFCDKNDKYKKGMRSQGIKNNVSPNTFDKEEIIREDPLVNKDFINLKSDFKELDQTLEEITHKKKSDKLSNQITNELESEFLNTNYGS